MLCFMIWSAPIDLKAVSQQMQDDPILAEVVKAIGSNWRSGKAKSLKPYYSMFEELTVKFNHELLVICKGSRVIVPESLHSKFLDMAHETHCGMNKLKAML